jgi:hypothetical protein
VGFLFYCNTLKKGEETMSHVATVKVRLKDAACLEAACRELGVSLRNEPHEVALFSGSIRAKASFALPGWIYPVAVQDDGQVKYDNYGGRWGPMGELNKVLVRYSELVAVRHARRLGMKIRREELPGGGVVLHLRS